MLLEPWPLKFVFDYIIGQRRAPKRPRRGNGAAWRAIRRLRVGVLIGSACGADIPQSLRRNRAGLDQRFLRHRSAAAPISLPETSRTFRTRARTAQQRAAHHARAAITISSQRLLQIGEGTSEIQKIIIAGQAMGGA